MQWAPRPHAVAQWLWVFEPRPKTYSRSTSSSFFRRLPFVFNDTKLLHKPWPKPSSSLRQWVSSQSDRFVQREGTIAFCLSHQTQASWVPTFVTISQRAKQIIRSAKSRPPAGSKLSCSISVIGLLSYSNSFALAIRLQSIGPHASSLSISYGHRIEQS